MIKRNGVAVMNARTGNVSIAKETLEVIKNKSYITPSGKVVDISSQLDDAIDYTILYRDKVVIPLLAEPAPIHSPTIEITNETATQAAVRLLASGKDNIVALNFASARNPGGGFLSGALAQEEDLCRASGLYACLKRKPVFYNENILCKDTFYTNNIIYSPDVPFFRDGNNIFLEEPYLLSIVSAPAPNLTALTNRIEGLTNLTKGVLRERAIKVLQIAQINGHKNIILGAWGCGAFGNDPEMVANVFKDMLLKIPAFEHICFAVYDTREPPIVYEAFKSVFSKT